MPFRFPPGIAGALEHALSSGEDVPRRQEVTTHSLALRGSGTLGLVYFTARRSETINSLTMFSGDTAAGATPTLVRWGIYEVDPATGLGPLVASIPNDSTLFATTFTEYIRALSAPWNKVAGQRYAAANLTVTAVAMPRVAGESDSFGQYRTIIYSRAPRMAALVNNQTDLPPELTVVSEERLRPFTLMRP